jgi:urease accessory protein
VTAAAEVAAEAAGSAAGWAASLELDAWRDGDTTRSRSRHVGPLRLLKALYPEGPEVCHQVLVHPPGGIVGGDHLDVAFALGECSHVLLTTPGATRWYRSDGRPAQQHVRLTLAAGARLEWLPSETIAHPGCLATSRVELDLAPGAEAMLSELLVLGLPASGQPFAGDADGCFEQHLAWPGRWLERGRIRAVDRLLLDSPLGLGGQPVVGTLAFCARDAGDGTPADTARALARQEALVEAARAIVDESSVPGSADAALRAGMTGVHPEVTLLRVVAAKAEPAQRLMRAVWTRWRALAWRLSSAPPRLWRC